MDPEKILNLHLLEDHKVLTDCKAALQKNGYIKIPNFATSRGIKILKEEILGAPYNESTRYYTPWQDHGDQSYADKHPRNFKIKSKAGFVGRKTLEKTSGKIGMNLYSNQKILNFLSEVCGSRLYRSKDENGSVYCYRVHANHSAPWHFDESPYTAIIYIQNGDSGGNFELVPWSRPTRSKDDPSGHAIVREVLMKENRSSVHTVDAKPGTLLFFSGAHSFHRAAPISSGVRIGLVFTFSDTQNFSNSEIVKSMNQWDPNDAPHLITASKL